MGQLNIISSSSSLTLIIIISLAFVIFGVLYSKKYQGLENYLVANRSIGVFSLTTSLVASALGAWILFGPASAATWGGIGAVIGYALGTAFPLFILIYLGKRFRKLYPNVDFYSGIILKAIGFPTSMFTVLFAIGRTIGWVSQWKEMIEDPINKIGRPRQLYTGSKTREYQIMETREKKSIFDWLWKKK